MKNILTIIAILVLPIVIYTIISNNLTDKTVIAAEKDNPTLITFTSTMCLDCQKMKNIIKEIENEYQGRVNFISINATEKDKKTKEIVKSNNITLVPTMIFLDKNRNEIKRTEGAISKEELISNLEELCNG